MSLQELKEQVLRLTPKERLALIGTIAQSLQEDSTSSQSERSSAIQRMRGLLKTDETAPTDQEVAAMLEERRMEKYLR